MVAIKDVLNKEQTEKLNEIKGNKAFNKKPFIKNDLKNYPDNIFKNIAMIIQNNAEFRRFISLAIKDFLIKENIISPTDKIYIRYFYKKYSVKINGLCREYFYTSQQFVQAYLTAIVAFSTNAQAVIAEFIDTECKNVTVSVDAANELAFKILNVKFEEEPETNSDDNDKQAD